MYYFYKIVCEDLPNYAYIGSTRSLRHRKSQHKTNCNNENRKMYNCKLYKTIRENGGWDNWRMVCIQQGEYENKRSAEIKEEELRLELNGNMNSQRCYITEEQKKEQLKECKKEYYSENREKILERCNKPFDCECGGKYTYASKARHLKSKKHQNFIN